VALAGAKQIWLARKKTLHCTLTLVMAEAGEVWLPFDCEQKRTAHTEGGEFLEPVARLSAAIA